MLKCQCLAHYEYVELFERPPVGLLYHPPRHAVTRLSPFQDVMPLAQCVVTVFHCIELQQFCATVFLCIV